MPRSLPALVLFLFAVAANAGEITGRVVGVSDGGTITVLSGTRVKIRLDGIRCPENGQPYGQNAKEFTSAVAYRTIVTVRAKGRDRSGHTLGEVILMDGRNLNRELVRMGLGWWSRKEAPNDRELARLEAEARAARIGLWADPDPVPPWEWGKAKRPPTSSGTGR